ETPKAEAASAPAEDPNDMGPFTLKPEWHGPCQRAEKVDVNLGGAAEVFVRAASCQIAGAEPSKATVSEWAAKLKKGGPGATRRIDVVLSLCKEAGRTCDLTYSEPWATDPDVLGDAPVKKAKRDIGAIFMFFFNCPGEVNCKMGWANTHAP